MHARKRTLHEKRTKRGKNKVRIFSRVRCKSCGEINLNKSIVNIDKMILNVHSVIQFKITDNRNQCRVNIKYEDVVQNQSSIKWFDLLVLVFFQLKDYKLMQMQSFGLMMMKTFFFSLSLNQKFWYIKQFIESNQKKEQFVSFCNAFAWLYVFHSGNIICYLIGQLWQIHKKKNLFLYDSNL